MKTLFAGRLRLEPLLQRHAEAMYPVLADSRIYEYMDYGPPESVEYLSDLYQRLEARQSPDGLEQWLNWVVLEGESNHLGFVQATVIDHNRAWVAYVLGSKYWGQGIGRLCTKSMIEHLTEEYKVGEFLACSERENARSISLLQSLDFQVASSEQAACHELTSTEILLVRKRQAKNVA